MKKLTNYPGRATWIVRLALGVCLVPALSLLTPRSLAALAEEESPPQGAAAKAEEVKEETVAPDQADAAGQPEAQTEKETKTYPVSNGTASYGRTEEVEKKKTADGEIETRRVRSPKYAGDNSVLRESEVRTKRLPDGTTEREYILKNPDGSGRMTPIEIIREKTRIDGEVTTTDREVLRLDTSGHWQPLRKERVTQTGEEKDRKSLKEVRERNLSGDWKVVDRTVTTEKSSEKGTTARAVRQTPNTYGELADYEVREESTTKDGDKQTRDASVRRRDTQDTHNPKFFLAERTRSEESKSADGRVTRKSVTESDLVSQGASRNITPGASKVVEEKTEVETTNADGSTRRVVLVKERGAVDRELQPSGRIVQQTDSKGNVREIYIPSR